MGVSTVAAEHFFSINIPASGELIPMKASPHRMSEYGNAIEPIVVEEVERQLRKLSPQLAKYIDSTQVVAYALNRLPALYATSEEGWERQQSRAKTELREQVVSAVRQGLAAVQRDPLRASTPLKPTEKRKEPNNPEKRFTWPPRGDVENDWRSKMDK